MKPVLLIFGATLFFSACSPAAEEQHKEILEAFAVVIEEDFAMKEAKEELRLGRYHYDEDFEVFKTTEGRNL